MYFSHSKLPLSAAESMRQVPIRTVSPYALMLAPVYVFMKRNEKFVAIKAPLNFFVPEELEKLRPLERFFIPRFVDNALPFRNAARRVLAVMTWQPPAGNMASDKVYPEVPLPPAPYEVSDAVIRIIGTLWSNGALIEPFFLTVFANEVCDLIEGEVLRKAREKNVDLFEVAILRASLAVFLSLHLGHCDEAFLQRFRDRVFMDTFNEVPISSGGSDLDEIVAMCASLIPDQKAMLLKGDDLWKLPQRAAQKIASRLDRIKNEFIDRAAARPTIFGQEGFISV